MSDNSMDLDSGEGPSIQPAVPTVNPPAAGEVVGPAAVPEELWVKYENAQPVEVSTAGCNNVSKFIKAVKKEMQLPDPPQNITLHTSEDAAAVRSGLSLAQAIVDAVT
ncbi:hypothetical protein MP638_003681, partial [Amoeboaphelidium occidentale]